MAVKRIVSTSFWDDDKVIDTFTAEDKYFMLYLLTNPHTRQLGIYPLNVKQTAFDMGYSEDCVRNLLERFETKHHVIKRSKITSEIAIINYLCYAVVKGGKPVYDCLEKDYKELKDKSLADFVFHELKNRDDLIETVKKFINDHIDNDNEDDKDNDIHKDNDIDNDNDSYADLTLTLRCRNEEEERENKENKEKNIFDFSSNEELSKVLPIAIKLATSGTLQEDDRKALYKLKWDIQCFKLNEELTPDNQENFNNLCLIIKQVKEQATQELPF